jgi:hypothetical protein
MMKRIVSLLALSLSGCLPIPLGQTDSPKLSGFVSRNGVPASGIRVCVNASNHKQPQCVVTQADGSFRLHAMTTTGYMSLVGDRVTSYTLTLQIDENDQAMGFRQTFTGAVPTATSLACDLSRPIASTFDDGPVTYCIESTN